MQYRTRNGRKHEVHSCDIHGEFLVRADKTNLSRDCRKCGKVHDTVSFIAKASKVHAGKFDYSLAVYSGSRGEVRIVCPVHGEFRQVANGHLNGRGCPKCEGKFRYDTESFIERAREVHGEKYDYSQVDYVRCDSPVKIVCPRHGEWEQNPSQHLSGKGCRACGYAGIDRSVWAGNGGWGLADWVRQAEKSDRFDSYKLYVLECRGNGERFCKVGRTFLPIGKRFFPSNIPYDFTPLLVLSYPDNPRHVIASESTIKRFVSDFAYTPAIPFKGSSECFIPPGVDLSSKELWAAPQAVAC